MLYFICRKTIYFNHCFIFVAKQFILTAVSFHLSGYFKSHFDILSRCQTSNTLND